MNKYLVAAALLLSFAIGGSQSAHAFGRKPRPAPVPNPTTTPYNYTTEELEELRLMNEYRLNMKLSEVKITDIISNECLNHNVDMIKKGKPSHDYFTTRSNIIQKALGAKRVGEIVAYNYQTPASVLAAWLKSPGHKKVIEGAMYRRVGYSMRTDAAGKKYYTMIFSD